MPTHKNPSPQDHADHNAFEHQEATPTFGVQSSSPESSWQDEKTTLIEEGGAEATVWLRNGDGEVFELAAFPCVMGRGNNCDFQIKDTNLSREHARILPYGGGFVIEDMGSLNGTFVNEHRVERVILADQDVIKIGDQQFEFFLNDPIATGATAQPSRKKNAKGVSKKRADKLAQNKSSSATRRLIFLFVFGSVLLLATAAYLYHIKHKLARVTVTTATPASVPPEPAPPAVYPEPKPPMPTPAIESEVAPAIPAPTPSATTAISQEMTKEVKKEVQEVPVVTSPPVVTQPAPKENAPKENAPKENAPKENAPTTAIPAKAKSTTTAPHNSNPPPVKQATVMTPEKSSPPKENTPKKYIPENPELEKQAQAAYQAAYRLEGVDLQAAIAQWKKVLTLVPKQSPYYQKAYQKLKLYGQEIP